MFIDTVHGILQERLEAAGFECVDHTKSDPSVIHAEIGSYTGVVLRSRIPIDKILLDQATKLKFIARSGSGMENIDLNYATEQTIKCYSAPEGNANAVGEHALGMLLNLYRNINRSDDQVRNNIWEREGNRGLELEGRTIGIIGYGNTGSAFAQKLLGFDVRIMVHDKYRSGFGTERIEECTIEDLKHQADIVSLHVPLTDDTRYMVDDDFILACQRPIWVMNTSRGAVVNTEDLVANMKTGKVLGACLDVLEYEKNSLEGLAEKPEALNYLASSDRTILTPHIAGWTLESYRKLSEILADKILADFPCNSE